MGRHRQRVCPVEAQERILALRAVHYSQIAYVMQGIKEVLAAPAGRGSSKILRAVPPAPTARQARTLTALR